MLVLIFTAQLGLSKAQEAIAQQVDLAGVVAFWEIAEKITNAHATDADWDQLFSTGYYRFYADWGQRDHIQHALMTALSPLKTAERDSMMKVQDFRAHTVKHILYTYAEKARLQALQKDFAESDLLKAVMERAKEFLPDDLDMRANEPFICFGVLQPDANASTTSIAVDLKLFFDLADPIGLIAHEYHHFMTMNYRKKFKEPANDSTRAIMTCISRLQLEGIADMIDKEGFLNSNGAGFPSALIETYRNALTDPLPALHRMDSLLTAISKDPLSTEGNAGSMVALFPLGGHPHGYHMAKTILQVHGKERLLSTVKDPFEFIRAYNTAYREMNGMAMFSEVSMNYLSQLERTHAF